MLVHVGMSSVVVPFEVCGRRFPAKVAIDALVVDVEGAEDVLRIAVGCVSHVSGGCSPGGRSTVGLPPGDANLFCSRGARSACCSDCCSTCSPRWKAGREIFESSARCLRQDPREGLLYKKGAECSMPQPTLLFPTVTRARIQPNRQRQDRGGQFERRRRLASVSWYLGEECTPVARRSHLVPRMKRRPSSAV